MAYQPFGHLRHTFRSNPIRNGRAHQTKCPICLKSRCTSKHEAPVKLIAAHKPRTVTHIAGYVPPKGSIAFALLGRVVQYQ